jgi:hypothetical protein
MTSDTLSCNLTPNDRTTNRRHALAWGLAIILILALTSGAATAQTTLPKSCTEVVWPTSGTIYRPSVIFTAPRSLIADSLLRLLPAHSWSVTGTGVEVIDAVRRLWKVDSALVEQALAEIISDNREFSEFSAVIAAQAYLEVSGRSDPLLSVFTEGGEPSPRLGWMLTALRPPLDTLAQAQVFGYACNAAWIALRSQSDPFLRARAAAEHEVFFRAEEEGILTDAERLVTGPLRADMQTLVRITRPKE